MSFELTASMMCADYSNLEKEVRSLDQGGIDSFHIDIMDGRYVSNFAMSLNDLRCIRRLTKKPLDVHLMVEHPINTIDLFIESLHTGDTIYIHPEADRKGDPCRFVFSHDYFPMASAVCSRYGIPYVSMVYDSPHYSLTSPATAYDVNHIHVFDRGLVEELRAAGTKNLAHTLLSTDPGMADPAAGL